MKNIVVFVSGNGSNLQAIIDSCKSKKIDGEISLVVSNRADAHALKRAYKENIKTFYSSYKRDEQSREEYEEKLSEEVKKYNPDLIVLAGWMHIFTNSFLKEFPGKVINLHPALPGKFPGANAIPNAFWAFRQNRIQNTGATVHHVTVQLDKGATVLSRPLMMYRGETLKELYRRMHDLEHVLIVDAINKFFEDNHGS